MIPVRTWVSPRKQTERRELLACQSKLRSVSTLFYQETVSTNGERLYLLSVDNARNIKRGLGTELLQSSLKTGALSRARAIGFLWAWHESRKKKKVKKKKLGRVSVGELSEGPVIGKRMNMQGTMDVTMGSLVTAGILKVAKLAVGTDMMCSVWFGREGMRSKEKRRSKKLKNKKGTYSHSAASGHVQRVKA